MALFKFRKGGDEPAAPAAQPESVEVLRRRARNRLIGAAILVLMGVVGFPLLVDKQPRPVAVDLPIDIPDRNKVLPLTPPAASPAVAASEPAPAAAPPAPATATPVQNAAAGKPQTAGAVVDATKPTPDAGKFGGESESRPSSSSEASKAEAAAKAPTEPRYVVQVGSFAEEQRARDVRIKLERAGIKSYIQTVDTKEGKRIRVRVGPFASKAEAERAAQKIKKLDLPAAIMGL
jgi:DedD protein